MLFSIISGSFILFIVEILKIISFLYKLAFRNPIASLCIFIHFLGSINLCMNSIVPYQLFFLYLFSLAIIIYLTCINQKFKTYYPNVYLIFIILFSALAILLFAYFNYNLFLEIFKLVNNLLKFNPINKPKSKPDSNDNGNSNNNNNNNNGKPKNDTIFKQDEKEKNDGENARRREKYKNRSDEKKARDAEYGKLQKKKLKTRKKVRI